MVTNYQAWMSQYRYGEGLGAFDCLVLDEAHAAPEEVAGFLAATLTPGSGAGGVGAQPDNPDIWLWIAWASSTVKPLKKRVDTLGEIVKGGNASLALVQEGYQSIRATLRVLERLSIAAPDEWIVTSHGDHEFHPVNVPRVHRGGTAAGDQESSAHVSDPDAQDGGCAGPAAE